MQPALIPSAEPVNDPCASAHALGTAVIPSVYDAEEITHARATVLENLHLMHKTRAAATSRHLAGFHRFPVLEPLHAMITGNPAVRCAIRDLCGPAYRTIGLSDITVNRSQQWHKDLLRGEFQHYLKLKNPCELGHGTLFKVLVYLQDSDSLVVIPGSHRQDIKLDNDSHAIPAAGTETMRVSAHAGDVVVLDICTTHRGSPDSAFESLTAEHESKILVSTVFGQTNGPLMGAMERGNAARLVHWMERHADHREPS